MLTSDLQFSRHLHRNTALVIVDVQNDFIEGSLNNSRAPAILPQLYKLLDEHEWPLIIASQDWHPIGHVSFASSHEGAKPGDKSLQPFVTEPTRDFQNQSLSKDHCVPGTWGAEIEPGVQTRLHTLEGYFTSVNYIKKAQNHTVDSYSAFADNQHYRFTTLNDELRAHKIDNIVLGGLVTNACVRGTSMDGIKLGYNLTLLSDATESTTQDVKDRALAELDAFGVYIMTTAEWEAQNKV
ncbi:hypothetical protein A1O7_08409 [Cladophialophora yegresii CBS 114405]|uniref:nicotinamidase n=1 Tax=Cladophialophora yegresii CBS 114405 TaxID=1182544 RepID=W9VII1_9EURO|nr:uncharacterized protein A1O7_08409 [Cladophialophora yegresii CBS 114405]EXJ55482.1 hypothetical protein A1O7_08409 [Cladophialophora yegresii CBS 114405]